MRSSLVVVVGVFALSGCELLALLHAPPVVIGGGGRGREEGDEGEGEEGEGEEGEAEDHVPADIPPHPLGPSIQSFSSSANRLDDNDSVTLTVVVSDPDGIEDIIGPLLLEPLSGATLGTLSQSAPGTFTTTIDWDLLASVEPIEFQRGGEKRFVRVQFSDNAGHKVTHTQQLDLFCASDAPACDSSCGSVRCPGQDNECLNTSGTTVSNNDLCSVCNIGCAACSNGCACFNESPSCNGNTDCVVQVNGNGEIEGESCLVNAGLTLRPDGFLSWSVGGAANAVLFERFTLPNGASSNAIGELLCGARGLDSISTGSLPSNLRSARTVLTIESGCSTASLNSLGLCEPVLGATNALNSDFQGTQVTCLASAGEGEGEGTGDFGQPCNAGDTCNGGNLFCNGGTDGNTCAEFCSSAFDCSSCSATTGTSCTCDTVSTGLCLAGGPPDDGNNVQGELRLVGGTGLRDGRLEIFANGAFGTVCDDDFGAEETTVACRQLGFGGGGSFRTVGGGSGTIVLDGMSCVGSESRLLDCSNPGIGVNDCSHSEDVGITCN